MPKTRRILKEFKLTEISAVDKPAQSPALATIMKRNDDTIEKRYLLSSDNDGHSHLLYMDKWEAVNKGGETSWTGSHYHPFVINDDGSITIGMADNHTHEVSAVVEDIFKNGLNEEQAKAVLALAKSSFDKPNTAGIGGSKTVHKEEINMPDINKADYDKALDEIATLKKSLATAVAMGTMNDAQKAHCSTLNGAPQEAFLAKSCLERSNELEAILKADEVIFKSETDGTEYRKSDDPRLIAMAKRIDNDAISKAKSDAIATKLRFEKRADDELSNLPGTVETRAAMLKAIDGIEDTEIKKAIGETLKACDSGLSTSFRTLGHEVTPKITKAADSLDSLAKSYATEHSVSIEDAYAKVLDTTEGQVLYAQSIN